MRRFTLITLFLVCLCLTSQVSARPILTEDATLLGKFNFQAITGISYRLDWFGSPENRYESVVYPFTLKLGLADWFDFGFSLHHMTHRLITEKERFKGSLPGYFSPEVKFRLSPRLSVMGIYHLANSEETGDLPVSRGKDFETTALYTLPTSIKVHVNIGYIWKGHYNSNLGISGGQIQRVEPGNIFLTKGALEFPLKWHFSLLSEIAYYDSGDRSVQAVNIQNSAGEAMDALVGLSWDFKGWNLGVGASFGLLDESHTSFELDRGAGDVTYHLSAAYKLKPRKPDQWD